MDLLWKQFVDLCGTIYDVKAAWKRHIKLFPQCLRSMSITTSPEMDSKSLGKAMDGIPHAITPCRSREDSGANCVALIPLEEQRLSCPENHDFHSEQFVSDQLEPEKVKKIATEGLQLVIPKVPGQCGEEAVEPDVSGSVVKEYSEIESVQALLALSRGNELQQEVDQESLLDPKSLSLDCLSLNPEGIESPESIPASSHEIEAPEEACRSSGIITESVCKTDENPSTSSPAGTSADDPAEIHSESVGPLSSASPPQYLVSRYGNGKLNQMDNADKSAQSPMSPKRHKRPLPAQAVPQPEFSVNDAGNQHQMNNADRVHRDSSSRFHGHSRYRRHASRHVPPEEQYPQDKMGTQMLVNQGNPGQPFSRQNQQNKQGNHAQHQIQTASQGNSTATHAWPIQNVQQENFASSSPSQVPSQSVTSQSPVSQYPMQSNELYGHMQNSQAYNQMWHYYYYQQQQHFIQQQQLQLQQHLPQQHPQEPQQLQQQQPQQQHQLQPSQQPQQQSHQQQVLQQQYQQQQLELQQHYLQQQQQFQHQQNHQQQLQQQHYILQQQQLQQQTYLQQQQHLLYLQQLQQQPQHEPQKQQKQQELQHKEDQEQPQQQQPLIATPSQIQQLWNNNYCQQVCF